MTLYNSDSKGKDDPMVSGPVNPLAAKVDITASHLGVKGLVKALVRVGLYDV